MTRLLTLKSSHLCQMIRYTVASIYYLFIIIIILLIIYINPKVTCSVPIKNIESLSPNS